MRRRCRRKTNVKKKIISFCGPTPPPPELFLSYAAISNWCLRRRCRKKRMWKKSFRFVGLLLLLLLLLLLSCFFCTQQSQTVVLDEDAEKIRVKKIISFCGPTPPPLPPPRRRRPLPPPPPPELFLSYVAISHWCLVSETKMPKTLKLNKNPFVLWAHSSSSSSSWAVSFERSNLKLVSGVLDEDAEKIKVKKNHFVLLASSSSSSSSSSFSSSWAVVRSNLKLVSSSSSSSSSPFSSSSSWAVSFVRSNLKLVSETKMPKKNKSEKKKSFRYEDFDWLFLPPVWMFVSGEYYLLFVDFTCEVNVAM